MLFDYRDLFFKLHTFSNCTVLFLKANLDLECSLPQVEPKLLVKLKNRVSHFVNHVGDPKLIEGKDDFAAIFLNQDLLVAIFPEIKNKDQEISANAHGNALASFDKRDSNYINLFLENIRQMLLLDNIDSPKQDRRAIGFSDDINVEKYINKGLIKNYEGDVILEHNKYKTEVLFRKAVRAGDLNALEVAFSTPIEGTEGMLAYDELRSLKNHANLVNVLSSREAIDAGVDYEQVYRLSDKLFLAVESVTTCQEALKIRYDIAKAFVLQVNDYNRKKTLSKSHVIVQRAEHYIKQNLYKKLCLDDIATHVNCNKDYLQRLFKQYRMMTIANYIKHERILLAKNLLQFSKDSISEIAYMLQFSSVSHFSRVFKEETKLLPSEFRAQRRVLWE